MKEKISKSMIISGIFLITFIIVNVILSTTLFIFKVSIQKWYAILSMLITIVFIAYLQYKNNLFEKKFKYVSILICIVFPIFIIISSTFISGKVYDLSWDGNMYHKETIGLLSDGWNPLYQSSKKFRDNNKKIEIPSNSNSLWIDHYARLSHVYQANIYSLTNNIESGKSINMISIMAVFLIIFSLLMIYLKKIVFPFIFGICVISFSVVTSQFMTNYIDLLVYLYLVLLIISLFMILYKNNKNINFLGYIIYFISLLMMINIKFTSFAYAGIYCFAFYIYFIIMLIKKKMDKKFFNKFTIISLLAVIIGVFVIGLSVYPKNFIDHSNPFYPVYGKNKVDIISENQPSDFVNKNSIEKYFITLFSKVDNITAASGLKVESKIPFTIYPYEVNFLTAPDTRQSGGGIFFSGILILSIMLIIINAKEMYKNNKLLLVKMMIIILITILLIAFISESWWIRYVPQIYFIILISLIFTYISKSKNKNIYLTILVTLLFLNNFITCYSVIENQYLTNIDININFLKLKQNVDNKKEKLLIYNYNTFNGSLYNVRDELGNYDIEIIKDSNLEGYNNLINNYIFWNTSKIKN